MMDDETYKRWLKEYISDLDINNIEYLSLTEDELNFFIMNNYLDYITLRLVSRKGDPYRPIGLTYLAFDNIKTNNSYEKSKRYLIGVCTNKKGTKTIISCIKYFSEYYHMDTGEPLTFIATIETNEYFRNKGLCKQIIDKLPNYVNMNQPLIITEESPMGRVCKTISLVSDSLLKNGFIERIQTVGEFTNEYYQNQLRRLLDK